MPLEQQPSSTRRLYADYKLIKDKSVRYALVFFRNWALGTGRLGNAQGVSSKPRLALARCVGVDWWSLERSRMTYLDHVGTLRTACAPNHQYARGLCTKAHGTWKKCRKADGQKAEKISQRYRALTAQLSIMWLV
jgi:hypothetical protein